MRCPRRAEGNVGSYGVVEQVDVLKRHREVAQKVVAGGLAHVASVHLYRAGIGIVET